MRVKGQRVYFWLGSDHIILSELFLLCTTGIFPFVLKHPEICLCKSYVAPEERHHKVQLFRKESSDLDLVPCKSAGNFLFSSWEGLALLPNLLGNTPTLVRREERDLPCLLPPISF